MEVVLLSFQIALSIAFPIFVVRRDLARLPAKRLARAWNQASLWSAATAFGPLCLIVHFARTRRSFAGLLLGICWALAGFLVSAALGSCLGA